MSCLSFSENCNSPPKLIKTTTLMREIFSFVWNIDQFSDFMDRKYAFSSPIFSSKSSKDTSWKLTVFPENKYPEGLHVTSRLIQTCNNDISYSVKYTISVINDNGKDIQQQIREKVFHHYLDFDECLLISNQKLKEVLQNGTLSINCEMDILTTKNPDDKLPDSLSSQKTTSALNNLSSENSYMTTSARNTDFLQEMLTGMNSNLPGISRDKIMNDAKNFKTRKSLEYLSDDFKSLYMNKFESDVTIRLADGEMRAHRAILVSRSEYFRKLCNSQGNSDIYLAGIRSATLDAILYYLYTGQLRHLTFEFAMDLLVASKTLNLNILQNMIQNFLKSQINVHNVTDIFRIAKEMNMEILKNSALKFVAANHTEVTKTENWNNMMRSDPHASGEILLTVASFQKNRNWSHIEK